MAISKKVLSMFIATVFTLTVVIPVFALESEQPVLFDPNAPIDSSLLPPGSETIDTVETGGAIEEDSETDENTALVTDEETESVPEADETDENTALVTDEETESVPEADENAENAVTDDEADPIETETPTNTVATGVTQSVYATSADSLFYIHFYEGEMGKEVDVAADESGLSIQVPGNEESRTSLVSISSKPLFISGADQILIEYEYTLDGDSLQNSYIDFSAIGTNYVWTKNIYSNYDEDIAVLDVKDYEGEMTFNIQAVRSPSITGFAEIDLSLKVKKILTNDGVILWQGQQGIGIE